MFFVDNEGITDPHINLAIEEHLLRRLKTQEDILLFYVNEPSIIIGRNQNTVEEINRPYVQAQGIHVVRRLSGGGAVYHDLGNLNFSFITQNQRDNIQNFRKFTAPVIQVLRDMGVHAELGGRNDILVEGRKISGNAQYIAAERMVSHGTLLFDADLSVVAEALLVKDSKIISKGIKSVRSRVANIMEFLPERMDLQNFRARLLSGIFAGLPEIPQYWLTPDDWDAIHTLANERYHSWEWNYGSSPAFNVQKVQRFAIGEIDARIDVQNGRIQSIRFYGDFFGQDDLAGLEAMLAGVRYDNRALHEALDCVQVTRYFTGITCSELIDLIV